MYFFLFSGRYSKTPLSHTTSVPSLPVAMTTNGNHDNNKDYDGLYESVMNFSTLKGDKDVTRDNNNSHKGLSKSSSVLVTSTVQSDSQSIKVNGNHRNSFHGDLDMNVTKNNTEAQNNEGQDENAPVAPKRPIRKKKSLRTKADLQMKEDVSRTSSNSSQSTERSRSDSGAKMPMEYFSDSSEMSPRDSPAGSGRKHAGKTEGNVGKTEGNVGNDGKSYGLAKGNSPEVTRNVLDVMGNKNNGVPGDIKVEHNKENRHGSTLIQVTNAPTSVPRVAAVVNSETESGIIMHIGKGDSANGVKQSNAIEELGNSGDNDEPLEVQTVEFSSQTQNFQGSDFSKLCSEEIQGQKRMDDLVGEKLKGEGTNTLQGMNGPATKSQLSASLEDLDDIDKILKEQVCLFTHCFSCER